MAGNMELTVPVSVKRESRYFIASCDILDVHSQGTTAKKANLVEALRLFIETCYEMDTLDDALRGAGLHPEP